MASTFLTAGAAEDEANGGFQPSAVDQQRLADREWRSKYDGEEKRRRTLERQLSEAEQRCAVQAARADAADAAVSKLELAAAEAAASTQALRAELSAELEDIAESVALPQAQEQRHVDKLRELEREVEAERSRSRAAAEEVERRAAAAEQEEAARKAAEASAAEEAAGREAALHEVAALKDSVTAVRAAAATGLADMRQQLRALRVEVGGAAAHAGRALVAFQHGELQQLAAVLVQVDSASRRERAAADELVAAAQAEAAQAREGQRALKLELRAQNADASSEFDSYSHKLSTLRQQLLDLDNEKCEQVQRAKSLQRECAALRADNTKVRERAEQQAAKLGSMVNALEARERQCTADFARLKAGADALADREHAVLLQQQQRQQQQQAVQQQQRDAMEQLRAQQSKAADRLSRRTTPPGPGFGGTTGTGRSGGRSMK